MMVAEKWGRPGRPGARWSARSAITALGVVALAVLPACSPEKAAPPAGEATAAESASPTGAGVEKQRPEASAESTSTATPASGGRGGSAGDEGEAARATTSGTGTATASRESDEELHRVIRVVDGDTVKVDINGGESVRVIGIDTPETVHPNRPDECGGAEASVTAKELLAGKRVALVFDASQGRRDKYGRLLAYLDIPGAGDFGETMLRAGHAKEYTYDSAYTRQGTYRAAEREARSSGKGIWGSCTQEPSQPPEPAPTSASAPTPAPTTQAPAPPKPSPAPAAPAPAAGGSAPGPGWTNDALTPGYTGCRQGYPGGKINGVYWWKPISC